MIVHAVSVRDALPAMELHDQGLVIFIRHHTPTCAIAAI